MKKWAASYWWEEFFEFTWYCPRIAFAFQTTGKCVARKIKLMERKPLHIKIVRFRAIRYYWADSESS